MAVPARPVGGEPTAAAWGQVAHDSIVAQDIQAGNANVTITAAPSGTLVLTFPRAFAAAPNVVVSAVTASNIYFAYVAAAPSATAVTLGVTRKDGTSLRDAINVAWVAYGPRA